MTSFVFDEIRRSPSVLASFQLPPGAFAQTRRVTSYDVGPNHRLTVVGLLRHLHDCAQAHASSYGFGYVGLAPLGLAWALASIDLHFAGALPSGETRFVVGTAVNRSSGPVVIRDYWAQLEGQSSFVEGQSMWALIDLNTRSTATPPHNLRQVLDEIVCPVVAGVNMRRLKPSAALPVVDRRTLRLHDCDFNGHLNNTMTVAWMIDALEIGLRDNFGDTLPKASGSLSSLSAKQVRVSYHQEAMLGEVLSIGFAQSESAASNLETYKLEVRNQHTQALIANAEITLEPFEPA